MSYIKIAQAVAGGLGIPLGKLTRKAIEKSKIPSRFKKFMTQERTTGELSQGPKNLIKGSVGVAEKEVKAFGKGMIGGLVGGEVVDLILKAAKAGSKGTDSKTKSSVSPTKRDKEAMQKTLDKKEEIKKRNSIINEKAATVKKQKQVERGVAKALKGLNMNKGGMPKKSHAKPGPYGKTYMKGGMATDMRKTGMFKGGYSTKKK